MDLFSFRSGIQKYPDVCQIESMSQELRNRLWTCVYTQFFLRIFHDKNDRDGSSLGFCNNIWHYYFKKPIDSIPYRGYDARLEIRDFFFNEAKWFEVYDFIEVCIKCSNNYDSNSFHDCINGVLESEFAGYRLINDKFVPITDIKEIDNIKQTLECKDDISVHIDRALQLLSDKSNPDYRNSIKESISAVEAICIKISGDPKASLGGGINNY